MRDEISYVESVPSHLKVGWNYALWYCQAAKSKVMNPNEFFKPFRTTSLSKAKAGESQWKKGGQFSEVTRLDTTIRLCAQRRANNLVDPKGFLKGLGFFLDRFVGKKPVRGLYTKEEFDHVQRHWDDRRSKVSEVYKNLPSQWAQVSQQPDGLKPFLDGLQTAGARQTKPIDDAVTQRIKALTFIPAKGRDKTPKIVPGADLKDKILNANISGLRLVGALLWSPLYGVNSTSFTDIALRIARKVMIEGNVLPDAFKAVLTATTAETTKVSMATFEGAYTECASCYVELCPLNRDQESWLAYFGVSGQL
jgi:hypothetical protein